MALWESLSELFQRDAAHLDRPVIPADHIFPPLADRASVSAGAGYFQIWAVKMFLKHDREWFKSWYPVVQSLTRFRFGNPPSLVELAQVANTFAKIEVARTRLLSYRWVSCKHPQRRNDKSLCRTL